MKYSPYWFIGAVVLLYGCAPPPVDIEAARTSLLAAAEAYHKAGEDRQFDRMADFYASDSMIMPPDEPMAKGLDGAEGFFESVAQTPGIGVRFGKPSVTVAASGDMGYTLADATIFFESDGEVVSSIAERDLHIWRKENGAWKIVVDIWNAKAAPASADRSSMFPDAVTADPDHYQVELENDQVRIIRVRYGPGEKSVMHSHGPHAAVILSDASISMTLPDGTVEDYPARAGDIGWSDGDAHQPQNLSDQPLEVVLVEVKE